ncbi:hypothetical protein RvY_17700 [Ramazzottius varieornatus]|uniref:Uncharacterized protein n=1 Tax=Ramazzottius varieornatus TaxID=947166 RepID=A0A1D1W312_RAMVA|nr:hypothetical protein RvY_17700 [Ramazzottius varieornatus]
MLRTFASGIIARAGLISSSLLLEAPVRRICLAPRSLIPSLPQCSTVSGSILSRCKNQRLNFGHDRRTFYGIPAAVNPAPASALLQPSSRVEVPMRMKSKKGRIYIPALRPDPLKQLRYGGYSARMSTSAGRAILQRRILAGRKYLHH